MSANEKIAQLEELLARIQTRAASPRAAGASRVPMQAAPPPMAAAADPTTVPPPSDPDPGMSDDDVDVEVSTETVEVDIDIDEPTQMESGNQPVMHPTSPPDELEEVTEDGPLPTQPTPNMRGAANEIDEPEPASSPRPIDAPYEEGSAPRHTPPPESGKQVASPSAHPPPSPRKPQPSAIPSEAPPSLEGHTLIGGWREPGLGPDGSKLPQVGVRVPGPPPPSSPAMPPPHAAPASLASGTRLTPDITKPNLPAAGGAKVATFEGTTPIARPATFGELLDLTLGRD